MIRLIDLYRFIILLLLLYVLAIGCNQTVENSSVISLIDPKETLKNDWLDDNIEDDIAYFPLESAKDLPLGVLEKCVVVDSICITTYRNRNGIFFHTLKGDFLHHFKTNGKGPLEFSSVNDIAKFDNNHILINDVEKRSILKYNFYEKKNC